MTDRPPQPGDARPRRVRCATRVVVRAGDSTLLFRDTDPGVLGSSWWTTPGGGLDEGEGWLDAGVRELREETGLEVPASAFVGPVAHRTVVHGYSDRVTTQEEMFFIVDLPEQLAGAPISTDGHTANERQRIVEHAWIKRSDLAGLTVWPAELAALLDADAASGCRELGCLEESTVPAHPTR